MALPTPDNLKTMYWAFQGQPFVDVPAKSTVVLTTMDYAFQAQPFVRNEGGGTTGSIPKSSNASKLLAEGII
jgi:hypothetical protein